MQHNILIKSPEEIAKMRIAGQLAAQVLEMIENHVQPGITTNALNDLCHEFILQHQAIPAPLNYRGGNKIPFPKSICTSVNQEVCHGIPSDRILRNGDIINIDVTVIKDGYHGDTSKMFIVGGSTSILAKRLITITQECLYLAIQAVKPGITSGVIGAAIQRHAEQANFSVVREYCGHGIGKEFHEQPQIVHFASKNPENNFILREGMIFTIEPMINAGKRFTKIKPDYWTVVTKDHSLSAQWEHTICITKHSAEILTKRKEESI